MDVKSLISEHYSSYSKSERKLANHILDDDVDSIVFTTITELSNELHIGEATIVRFCKKIGFNGFQDFKLMLALEKEKGVTNQKEGAMHHLRDKIVNVLDNSINRIQDQLIKQVSEVIHEASDIYIIGVGASGYIAEIFEDRLMRIGVASKAIKEGHRQLSQLGIAKKEDLVIAISLTGITEDIYLAVEEAKKRECRVIAMTNHKDSPIAQIADYVLLTAGYESPLSGGDFFTIVSQLFILTLICEAYTEVYQHDVYESKTNIAKLIRKKVIIP